MYDCYMTRLLRLLKNTINSLNAVHVILDVFIRQDVKSQNEKPSKHQHDHQNASSDAQMRLFSKSPATWTCRA